MVTVETEEKKQNMWRGESGEQSLVSAVVFLAIILFGEDANEQREVCLFAQAGE